MSGNRYSHWFWHSAAINWVDRCLCDLNSWLWHKRFGRYYRNDFWHAVDDREKSDD
jgi:hypothetical protein